MTIKQKLEAMRQRCEAADRLVCDLASGKKKWNMCVPPQKDDTDMVLIEPVRSDNPKLIEVVEVCLAALEKYENVGFKPTFSDDPGHMIYPARDAKKKAEAILGREG